MIAARFLLVYFFTALLDYSAFLLVHASTGSILQAQIAGRAVSVPFNYLAVRSKVFASEVPHQRSGPKFVLLYVASFLLSWGLIVWMSAWMPVVVAKMIAEGGLLIAKFFVQKHLIFAHNG